MCSAIDGICRYTSSIVAVGYQCITPSNLCSKCPTGTYGDNGMSCASCPIGTWSQFSGSVFCSRSFTYSKEGGETLYIPREVKKVEVKLFGGGGGGFVGGSAKWKPGFGGGGGYASCNITVKGDSLMYLIVAGGGKTESSIKGQNYGGNLPNCHLNTF